MGFVAKKEKAQLFTHEEEEKMWQSGILGESTPEQLLNTVIFLLGIHLSLHAVDEHKALKVGYWSPIKVKFDKDADRKFLQHTEQ